MIGPSLAILVAGDLHIGRRPASLPAGWAADPRFSATAAWEQIVETALAEGVDALALTGDVVDRDNRFYEAFGPLTRGLRRLAEAGIETLAVAGNHDFDVLPRLAEQVRSEHFHLLGRGGIWERRVIARPGRPAFVAEGWSFPREHFREDPLAARDFPRLGGSEAELPVLGLLHTELGVPASPYAPTTLAGLRLLPVTAWLLGHVHAPQRFHGPEAPVLYPGSPLALDAREPGVHGPWLLRLEGRRVVSLEQLPRSPTRYETVEVDLGGTRHAEEVEERRNEALGRALAGAVEEGGEALALFVARLRLTGATALGRESLERLFAKIEEDLRLPLGEATGVVRQVVCETRPEVNLGELARAADPAGDLARTLLALQAGEPPPDLLRSAREGLRRVHGATPYQHLPRAEAPGTEEVRHHLLAAGLRLLDALLVQKGVIQKGAAQKGATEQGATEQGATRHGLTGEEGG